MTPDSISETVGTAQPPSSPETSPPRRRGSTPRWWTTYAVVLITVGLGVIFSITNSSTFPTSLNFQIVSGSNAVTLLLALGSLPVLIGGDFDLSVGYTLELGAVGMAQLVGTYHVDLVPAILIVLAGGTLIGLINGILVAKVGISSFIATIGVGSVLEGISLEITNGRTLINGIPNSLLNFSQDNTLGIPNVVFLALVVCIIFWIGCEHTPYGRRLLAIGLSRRSADLLGMRVDNLRISAFVIAGFMAALAGIVELGRTGSATSGIGPSFLLPAVAAAFLGATTIKVGRFNVVGTVVAVILVGIGVSGLELNGVPNWVEPVFDGVVLVLAVGTSRIAARRGGS
jgi:ribose transport system permease protein